MASADRDRIGEEVNAILRKRLVPEPERIRYGVVVLDRVCLEVELGELKDWPRIRLEAQRQSISFAKEQLKVKVDEAVLNYRTVHAANHGVSTDDTLGRARRQAEYAIETFARFAVGGRVRKELADSLPREVIRAVAHLFTATASAVPPDSPGEQVWANAVMLAAERQKTSVALWWERTRLPGKHSKRATDALKLAIYELARKVARKRHIRDLDIVPNLWMQLMGEMTEKKLERVVNVDAYIEHRAEQRLISLIRKRKMDCNTEDRVDPETLVNDDESAEDMLYDIEVRDQVRAIITDPDWDVSDDYRSLLERIYVDRIDERDVVEATVEELFARPDNTRSRQELRKLVRKRLDRAMSALRVAYYQRYVKEERTR